MTFPLSQDMDSGTMQFPLSLAQHPSFPTNGPIAPRSAFGGAVSCRYTSWSSSSAGGPGADGGVSGAFRLPDIRDALEETTAWSDCGDDEQYQDCLTAAHAVPLPWAKALSWKDLETSCPKLDEANVTITEVNIVCADDDGDTVTYDLGVDFTPALNKAQIPTSLAPPMIPQHLPSFQPAPASRSSSGVFPAASSPLPHSSSWGSPSSGTYNSPSRAFQAPSQRAPRSFQKPSGLGGSMRYSSSSGSLVEQVQQHQGGMRSLKDGSPGSRSNANGSTSCHSHGGSPAVSAVGSPRPLLGANDRPPSAHFDPELRSTRLRRPLPPAPSVPTYPPYQPSPAHVGPAPITVASPSSAITVDIVAPLPIAASAASAAAAAAANTLPSSSTRAQGTASPPTASPAQIHPPQDAGAAAAAEAAAAAARLTAAAAAVPRDKKQQKFSEMMAAFKAKCGTLFSGSGGSAAAGKPRAGRPLQRRRQDAASKLDRAAAHA